MTFLWELRNLVSDRASEAHLEKKMPENRSVDRSALTSRGSEPAMSNERRSDVT